MRISRALFLIILRTALITWISCRWALEAEVPWSSSKCSCQHGTSQWRRSRAETCRTRVKRIRRMLTPMRPNMMMPCLRLWIIYQMNQDRWTVASWRSTAMAVRKTRATSTWRRPNRPRPAWWTWAMPSDSRGANSCPTILSTWAQLPLRTWITTKCCKDPPLLSASTTSNSTWTSPTESRTHRVHRRLPTSEGGRWGRLGRDRSKGADRFTRKRLRGSSSPLAPIIMRSSTSSIICMVLEMWDAARRWEGNVWGNITKTNTRKGLKWISTTHQIISMWPLTKRAQILWIKPLLIIRLPINFHQVPTYKTAPT